MSHSYPFFYVSLVSDKNTHAEARLDSTEYNLAGFPTAFFDGGYRVNVGADPDDIPAQVEWYRSTIIECGSRVVPDIDVDLSLEWLGNATVNVAISVQNNEASGYDGRVRAYVTEKVSRRDWRDSHGRRYEYAFLDYAFNEDIYVDAGASWNDTVAWNGNSHDDGYGNDFGDLAQDNVMVIAAVFNAEWDTGYAYPGDTSNPHPFEAHYVDETGAAWFNSSPNVPSSPNPAIFAKGVDVHAHLSWTGGDIDPGDTVTYDVYFGTEYPPLQVAWSESAATYDPGTMDYDTTYYWRIVAKDNHGAAASGPAWRFSTNSLPYEPYDPDPPDSAVDVSLDADLSWTGGDPDPDDTVSYDVYLGTEMPPPQVAWSESASTYDPGTMDSDTTYYWQIVTFDRHGESTAGSIWRFRTVVLPWVCGDCNGDGFVNFADALYVKNYYYQTPPGSPAPIGQGDVNLDGFVNFADALYLKNYYYQTPPGSPPPCNPPMITGPSTEKRRER